MGEKTAEEDRAQLLRPEQQKERSSDSGDDSFGWLHEFNKDRTFFIIMLLVSIEEGSQALGALAISYFFKDDLGVSPSTMQFGGAVVLSPWIVKPLWGIITDSFPIAVYRRKSYLILFSALSGAMSFVMAFWVHAFWSAVIVLLAKSIASAFCNVVAKGIMVERSIGKSQRFVSWLQSLYFGAGAIAGMIAACVHSRHLFAIQLAF